MGYYERVKELCTSEGISIFYLESKLQIGNGTIGKWNHEKSLPSIQTLKKIADYFNVPLSYLVEGD